MKEEILREYYKLFTYCWTFFKKYGTKLTKGALDCDAFWNAATLDGDSLAGKYKGTDMERAAVKLTVATIMTLQYAAETIAKSEEDHG